MNKNIVEKYSYTVERLIKELQLLDPKQKVMIASDEEWNTIFKGITIDIDEDNNIVLFGLSGLEL